MNPIDDARSGAGFTIRTLTIQLLPGRAIVPCVSPSHHCGPLSWVAFVDIPEDPELEEFSRELLELTRRYNLTPQPPGPG
jgi:hypothetical protein